MYVKVEQERRRGLVQKKFSVRLRSDRGKFIQVFNCHNFKVSLFLNEVIYIFFPTVFAAVFLIFFMIISDIREGNTETKNSSWENKHSWNSSNSFTLVSDWSSRVHMSKDGARQRQRERMVRIYIDIYESDFSSPPVNQPWQVVQARWEDNCSNPRASCAPSLRAASLRAPSGAPPPAGEGPGPRPQGQLLSAGKCSLSVGSRAPRSRRQQQRPAGERPMRSRTHGWILPGPPRPSGSCWFVEPVPSELRWFCVFTACCPAAGVQRSGPAASWRVSVFQRSSWTRTCCREPTRAKSKEPNRESSNKVNISPQFGFLDSSSARNHQVKKNEHDQILWVIKQGINAPNTQRHFEYCIIF